MLPIIKVIVLVNYIVYLTMPELTLVWVLALLLQRQCRRSEAPFETIARIQQPYNIRVVHKPITTLRRLLTNFKDKDKPEG